MFNRSEELKIFDIFKTRYEIMLHYFNTIDYEKRHVFLIFDYNYYLNWFKRLLHIFKLNEDFVDEDMFVYETLNVFAHYRNFFYRDLKYLNNSIIVILNPYEIPQSHYKNAQMLKNFIDTFPRINMLENSYIKNDIVSVHLIEEIEKLFKSPKSNTKINWFYLGKNAELFEYVTTNDIYNIKINKCKNSFHKQNKILDRFDDFYLKYRVINYIPFLKFNPLNEETVLNIIDNIKYSVSKDLSFYDEITNMYNLNKKYKNEKEVNELIVSLNDKKINEMLRSIFIGWKNHFRLSKPQRDKIYNNTIQYDKLNMSY